MLNKRKKGFTLVELLAVIVILAIILVIAVPKVMDVIEDSKKATLESTAKMIASSAEKQKVQNTVLGKIEKITCESVAKLNDVDYANCSIEFDGNTAKVTITGSGKFDGLNVCGGTKTEASATDEECPLVCKNTENMIVEEVDLYNIKDYDKCVSYTTNKLNSLNISLDGLEPTLGCKNEIPDYFYMLVYGYGEFTEKELVENGIVEGKLSCVENGLEYMTKVCPANTDCSLNNLMRDSDGNIRYIGNDTVNTNNYIEFNNEVWRIVGAFNVKKNASDTTTEMRLKIVKNESIGERTYTGSWETSDLKTYLNGDYYNSLSSTAKNQIEKVVWNTGEIELSFNNSTGAPYAKSVDSAYTDEKKVQTDESIIGLLNASDYGYANYNCDNILSVCKDNNSLFKGIDYWILSDISGMKTLVEFAGNIYGNNNTQNAVFPVVYLKSNVKLTGTGENTPEGIYRISQN